MEILILLTDLVVFTTLLVWIIRREDKRTKKTPPPIFGFRTGPAPNRSRGAPQALNRRSV